MVTKIQVLVREVYEQEETESIWVNSATQEKFDDYDYKNLDDDKKEGFVMTEVPTGKMELLTTENDPVYGQVFAEEDLDIKELILHLNRVK